MNISIMVWPNWLDGWTTTYCDSLGSTINQFSPMANMILKNWLRLDWFPYPNWIDSIRFLKCCVIQLALSFTMSKPSEKK